MELFTYLICNIPCNKENIAQWKERKKILVHNYINSNANFAMVDFWTTAGISNPAPGELPCCRFQFQHTCLKLTSSLEDLG